MSILRDNINLGPREIRRQIKSGFVVAAGVFNGISAIQAERAGNWLCKMRDPGGREGGCTQLGKACCDLLFPLSLAFSSLDPL